MFSRYNASTANARRSRVKLGSSTGSSTWAGNALRGSTKNPRWSDHELTNALFWKYSSCFLHSSLTFKAPIWLGMLLLGWTDLDYYLALVSNMRRLLNGNYPAYEPRCWGDIGDDDIQTETTTDGLMDVGWNLIEKTADDDCVWGRHQVRVTVMYTVIVETRCAHSQRGLSVKSRLHDQFVCQNQGQLRCRKSLRVLSVGMFCDRLEIVTSRSTARAQVTTTSDNARCNVSAQVPKRPFQHYGHNTS